MDCGPPTDWVTRKVIEPERREDVPAVSDYVPVADAHANLLPAETLVSRFRGLGAPLAGRASRLRITSSTCG